MDSEQKPEILFKEHKKPDGSFLGEIRLSRPEKLNALSLNMILRLGDQLRKWRDDPSVSLVFLHGAGPKAFSAGGDVRSMWETIQEARRRGEDPGLAVRPFFENEYKTNYLMSRYPKPIAVFGHGLVMGGGMGLFAAASHALAAESASFAMPEISIGLFPDVGGSFFLSRAPKGLGWFLALTACRFSAAEARRLNFCRYILKDSGKDDLFRFLVSVSFEGAEDFGRQLEGFLKTLQAPAPPAAGESWLESHQEEISRLVESKDIQAIQSALKNSKIEDKKWLACKKAFFKGSPTSAGVICGQLRRGEAMSLKEAFQMELILACQFARRHDFSEGVRALLVEKTGAPAWDPPRIEDLTEDLIQGHFQLPEGYAPLVL